ncbi:hypothetical protein HQ584_09185 [Patescibacteria group bacterium]|nr:hypothetical protein [Patescibacteria group bacterium]
MQNPYQMFETDTNLEKTGIWIDYGSFRIKTAFAGGANTKHERLMTAKTKPHLHSIQSQTIDKELERKISVDVWSETVFLDWETTDAKTGKVENILLSKKGEKLKFSKENVKKIMNDLPKLFQDLQRQSLNFNLFKQDIVEEDVKK